MSLINQVLRSLDQRATLVAAVPATVHAVAPAAARRHWVLVAAAAGAAALLATLLLHVEPLAGRFSAKPTAAPAQEPAAALPVAAVAATPVGPPPAAPGTAAPAIAAARSADAPLSVAAPEPRTRPAAAEQAPAATAHPAPGLAAGDGNATLAQPQRLPGPDRAARPAAVDFASPAPAAKLAVGTAANQTRADADARLDADTSAAGPAARTPAARPGRGDRGRAPAPDPRERAQADYRAGVAAHEQGNFTEAARAYAAALQADASLAPARIGLAGILIAQGRAAESEALLQAGLALNPQQALLAQPLARLLVERGHLAAALAVMQAGLQDGAADAGYRAAFGAMLQRADRHGDAIAQFEAALRLAPANGVWWMGLAISHAADGRGDAARWAYSRAWSSGSLSPELARFVEQKLRQLP